MSAEPSPTPPPEARRTRYQRAARALIVVWLVWAAIVGLGWSEAIPPKAYGGNGPLLVGVTVALIGSIVMFVLGGWKIIAVAINRKSADAGAPGVWMIIFICTLALNPATRAIHWIL